MEYMFWKVSIRRAKKCLYLLDKKCQKVHNQLKKKNQACRYGKATSVFVFNIGARMYRTSK